LTRCTWHLRLRRGKGACEFVALRISAIGEIGKPPLETTGAMGSVAAATKQSRQVYSSRWGSLNALSTIASNVRWARRCADPQSSRSAIQQRQRTSWLGCGRGGVWHPGFDQTRLTCRRRTKLWDTERIEGDCGALAGRSRLKSTGVSYGYHCQHDDVSGGRFAHLAGAALIAAPRIQERKQGRCVSARSGPPTGIWADGVNDFAAAVKSRTNGALDRQGLPSSQLGNERELEEGLQLGNVDFTFGGPGVLANFDPKIGIFDMPFMSATMPG